MDIREARRRKLATRAAEVLMGGLGTRGGKSERAYQPDKSVQLDDGDCGGGNSIPLPVNQARPALGACESTCRRRNTNCQNARALKATAAAGSTGAGEGRPTEDAA